MNARGSGKRGVKTHFYLMNAGILYVKKECMHCSLAAREGCEPVSDFIVECSYDRKKESPFVFILHFVRYGDEKFRFLSILDFCIASYDEENPHLLSL